MLILGNIILKKDFKRQHKVIFLIAFVLCLATAIFVHYFSSILKTNPSSKPEIYQQESNSQSQSGDELINNEINWVLSNNQLDSGVITMNGKHQGAWIVPYQTSYFGIHALKAKPNVAPQIKKYILWHFDHINTQPDPDGLTGTIFDFNVSKIDLVPTYIYTPGAKLYDSVDSYAAVFFTLLRTYWDTTHDSQLLIDNKSKIELIFGALMAVMKTDNLTQGTATWNIQYAPDNFEVNVGLNDLAYLYKNVLDNNPKANDLKQIADKNKIAIETTLWNNSFYKVSKQQSLNDFNWEILYPDAYAQIWGIACNYLSPDSSKARELYSQFAKYQPKWASADGDKQFPFTFMAYTAVLIGDFNKAKTYDNNLRNKNYFPTKQWPWNTGEAAFYIAYHHLLKTSPIAFWKLDEGRGITIYDEIKESHGSLFNGPVWTSSKFGKALSFDGVDDYVLTLANFPLDNDFTISTWVNSSKISSLYPCILCKSNMSTPLNRIELLAGGTGQNGQAVFSIYSQYSNLANPSTFRSICSGANISDGKWHNIVGVKTSSHLYLYVDGVLKSSDSHTLGNYSSSNPWTVGGGNGLNNFLGKIDHVKIYNYALNATQIVRDYNNTSNGFYRKYGK